MPNFRFIRPLSEQEIKELQDLYRTTSDPDIRTRCQIILLSSQGYNIDQIASITLYDRDSVIFWFKRYEASKLTEINNKPRSGRPRLGRPPKVKDVATKETYLTD